MTSGDADAKSKGISEIVSNMAKKMGIKVEKVEVVSPKNKQGGVLVGNIGEALNKTMPKYKEEVDKCCTLPEFELILQHVALDATRYITEKSSFPVPDEVSNRVYEVVGEKLHSSEAIRKIAANIAMQEETNEIIEKLGEKRDYVKMTMKDNWNEKEDEDDCDCERGCDCGCIGIEKDKRKFMIARYRDAIINISKLYQDTLDLYRITEVEAQKILYQIRNGKVEDETLPENLVVTLALCTELDEYKLIYKGLLYIEESEKVMKDQACDCSVSN